MTTTPCHPHPVVKYVLHNYCKLVAMCKALAGCCVLTMRELSKLVGCLISEDVEEQGVNMINIFLSTFG